MILLDGKKLSQKIIDGLKEEILQSEKKMRLAVVVVGQNPVIQKFVAQKRKTAKYLGIGFKIYPFPDDISTNDFRQKMAVVTHNKKNTGVVIQLPLPKQVNVSYILNSVLPEKDVDMLSVKSMGKFASGKSSILPPVVGAVKALLEEYKMEYKKKNIVIVGAGNLVGKPLAIWLLSQKISFSVVEKDTLAPEKIIKEADILISGIGRPGYIKGDWIKKGAVVIDAGTSEEGSKISGDMDFASVSEKAGFLTPVPGGIGPLTVALLYKNLFILSQQK